MLVSGVRSSWLMAARNSVLAWLAAWAWASLRRSASLACSSLRRPSTKPAADTKTAALSSPISTSVTLRVLRQGISASSAPLSTRTNSGYSATRRKATSRSTLSTVLSTR